MLAQSGRGAGRVPARWRAAARHGGRLTCLGAAVLAAAALLLGVTAPGPAHAATVVSIPDTHLEWAVRRSLNKLTGAITDVDMQSLPTWVNWAAVDIKDLTGVQYATNLTSIELGMNEITDVTPLAGLTKLNCLYLGENQISNIAPLANLTNLASLKLKYNRIADITPLAGMSALQYLDLNVNEVTDVSPLAGLSSLTTLLIAGNSLTDITALQELRLMNLDVTYNYLDITPGSPTMNTIAVLQARRAEVLYSPQRQQVSDPIATTTKLSGPSSVKVKKSLKLGGTVSPSAAPGRITIVMTRLVAKKWKASGSASVSVTGGAFTYSFKPAFKGSWRFVAKYSGGAVGTTAYKASKSAVKGVTVK
jgi:hypothetical protein